MGQQKKPWDDVPVEVLIEYERKKNKQREDHREQLRAPMLRIPEYIEAEEEQEDEHVIIIKL
jgi:hypothetical protein